MLEEKLKFVKDIFDKDYSDYIIEREYLRQIKEKLKDIIGELRGTLLDNEVLSLFENEPDIHWIVVNKKGRIRYCIASCEGSWGGSLSLKEYFDEIITSNDAYRLYKKISKPMIYDTKDGILKFKEERDISASPPTSTNQIH